MINENYEFNDISVENTNQMISNNTKTRFIVTRSYSGETSMDSLFKEVIENRVIGDFEQLLEENLN